VDVRWPPGASGYLPFIVETAAGSAVAGLTSAFTAYTVGGTFTGVPATGTIAGTVVELASGWYYAPISASEAPPASGYRYVSFAANSGQPARLRLVSELGSTQGSAYTTNAPSAYAVNAVSATVTNAPSAYWIGGTVSANVVNAPSAYTVNAPSAYVIGDTTPDGFAKNASAVIAFLMTDSTDHNPNAGLTVTSQRSIDGAAFASCSNAASGIGNGAYSLTASAADMNGDLILFRFSATGADDRLVAIRTVQ
jgi:hypothetical protein